MKMTLLLTILCMFLATITATTATAKSKPDRIRINYVPPKEPAHKTIYDDLQERRTLEKLQEFLSPFLLPKTLEIRLAGCEGEADAFYGDDVITICYEYVEYLWNNKPEKTTPSGIEPIDAFVGPLIDTSLHEFAHALFDMLDVPLFGPEEAAADYLAAYIYLQLGPVESVRLIRGTAYAYWFEAQSRGARTMTEFADEHGTPMQRAYNILCIAYGADEKVFDVIVSGGALPMERAEYCWEEYEQVEYAFNELIGPHIDKALAKKVFNRAWLGNLEKPELR
jgi:hypothetical protein